MTFGKGNELRGHAHHKDRRKLRHWQEAVTVVLCLQETRIKGCSRRR